jgi:hypothetical protein
VIYSKKQYPKNLYEKYIKTVMPHKHNTHCKFWNFVEFRDGIVPNIDNELIKIKDRH